MAYGFNEDRSKVPVYTKAEIDAMDFADDQALAQEVADRQAAVSQEAVARSAGDSALDARISNIIAQGQSTEGNTELIDIRNGYDGTNYETAGDAVRFADARFAQVADLVIDSATLLEMESLPVINSGKRCYQRHIGSEQRYVVDEIDSSDFGCGSISMTGGQWIYLSAPFSQSNFGSSHVVIFSDTDDTVTGVVNVSDFTEIEEGHLFQAPAKTVKMSYNIPNSKPFIAPSKINTMMLRDAIVEDMLMSSMGSAVSPDMQADGIWSTSNWGTVFQTYKGYVYKVTPGEKIHLTTTIPGSNQFCAAVFFADCEDDTVAGLKTCNSVYRRYVSGESVDVDDDIIVPSGANYMLVSNNTGGTVVRHYKMPNSEESYSVSKDSDNIIVTYDNVSIDFKKTGPNSIFQIDKYTIGNVQTSVITDIFPSPLIIYAVNNIDGDMDWNVHFTGGWHGYNNDATGTPTARSVSIDLYCDGALMQDGTYSCDEVVIKSVNNVQANNTKKQDGSGREVLQEEMYYIFKNGRMYVSNTITALEEINLSRWYGMQIYGFSAGNDTSQYSYFGKKVYKNQPRADYPENDIPHAIVGIKDGAVVTMHMDNTGVGDKHLHDYPGALISGSKAYYRPVYGTVHMDQNDALFLSGYYSFGLNIDLPM